VTSSNRAVDIGATLDEGPFSALQRIVVALAAFAIVMDGFDGQLIGFAIPAIIKDWGVTRGAFAPAVAAGLFGMALGSAGGGIIADRLGRRRALAASVLLFGAATCAIGFAGDILTIAALRFVAGLGIGGALPSASTLAAEFTPARRRTLAVTLTIVSYPLGGMVAGLFASAVLPAHGWRALFWVGGLLPIIVGVVLWTALPESPRFLTRHREAWPRLRALLSRMGRPLPDDTTFFDAAEQRVPKASGSREGLAEVFGAVLRRDTLALSAAFFMCMLASYSAFSWLPTMLASEGLPLAIASSGLTAYNLGGCVGAVGCALLITRIGSRRALLLASLGAAASAFAMQAADFSTQTAALIVGLGVHGLFVNAVQATMYALCAHVYPTEVRATGTATALSLGRFGAILSSFAGAAVITSGGATGYLGLLGGAMACVLVALMAIKRHIPGRASEREVGEPIGAPQA
jgi:AAHS family 4-hydroxybenzoate transporter-like MFS transporter